MPVVDKFYVYALFKPGDSVPFYVGKGKGDRINQHFKESSLKQNTHKNNIIKSFKGQIKREILAYFDKEDDAFTFEEYLISLYGVDVEGGCLVNLAKTRNEYSSAMVAIAAKGSKCREKVYADSVIWRALDMFFNKQSTNIEISRETDIPIAYLPYILSGAKNKHVFKKYLLKNTLTEEDASRIRHLRLIEKTNKTFENEDILKVAERILAGGAIETVFKNAKFTRNYFLRVCRGEKRKYLQFDKETCKKLLMSENTKTEKYLVVSQMIKDGMKISEILKTKVVSKTHLYRILKDMSKGSGNGTSDSVAGTDNSSLNTENAA